MTFYNFLETFLLALLQGVSEFLPISSSGHLVLAQNIFKIKNMNLLLILVLHAGSLVAILNYYKKDILYILTDVYRNKFNISNSGRPIYLCIVALFPSFIGFWFLADFIEKQFFLPVYTAIGFLFTGCFLFLTKFVLKKEFTERKHQSEILSTQLATDDWQKLSYKKAFLIGCSQVLAFMPGMSRSGCTISTALFLKIPHHLACFFSFLLAIPAIAGGLVWNIFQQPESLSSTNIPLLISALFGSWLFSHFALKILIRTLQNKMFPFFAFYLWPLGVLTLIYIF